MTSWRFVGRAKELGLLAAAVAAADAKGNQAGKPGRGLLVGGPKGMGKTRLLREALRAIDPARVAVHAAYATAATADLPLGSFAHELPADHPAGLSPAGRLRWATDAVCERAAGRTIVFALDDIHLLDPLSIALVHLMAHAGQAIVLATLRDGEPIHDSLTGLWKDDLVERIRLAPFTPSETTHVLSSVLGGAVDPTAVRRLHQFGKGNPQLLRELITAARAAGDFVESYGLWRWAGHPRLSSSLVETLDDHIGPIDEEIRRVVEFVAVGEPVELRLLASIADNTAVEAAEERHLIAIDAVDRRLNVRLAHPLYGELIRQRCPLTRKQRVLTTLADLVTSTGARRRDDRLRIVTWRLDARRTNEPDELLAAAHDSLGHFDAALGRRLAAAAAEAASDLASRVEAQRLLASSLLLSGEGEAAAAALAAMDARTGGPSGPAPESIDRRPAPFTVAANDSIRSSYLDDPVSIEQRGRWLATKALIAHWGCYDASAMDGISVSAEHVADPAGRAELIAVEAIGRLHLAQTESARRHAEAVLADPYAQPTAQAQAIAATAHLAVLAGETSRALGDIAAVETASDSWRTVSPFTQFAVDLAAGNALVLAGDLPGIDARVHAEPAGAYERGSFLLGEAYRNIASGQAARMRGRLTRARRYQTKACAILGDDRILTSFAHAERAHAAALSGAAAEAEEAMRRSDDAGYPGMAILYPWLEHARCWVFVSRGDLDSGRIFARDLAARLRGDGFAAHEAIALHDMVRMGVGEDAVDRLSVLAREVDGALVMLMARHARSATDRDAAGLLSAAHGFADLGYYLYAAEAAAAALNRLRQVRSTRITDAAKLLTTLLARCEEARTPGLVISRPALSARERQVAQVAAQGLTSKEIADQLYLSTRTVDNHLRRVYAKLGVTGRGELGAALGTLGELSNVSAGAGQRGSPQPGPSWTDGADGCADDQP